MADADEKRAARTERIAAYKKTDKYSKAKQGARKEINKIRPQLKKLKRVLKRA